MKELDPSTYLSFWQVAVFSCFIATNEMFPNSEFTKEKTNASLLYAITVMKSSVHHFALASLIMSIAEMSVSHVEGFTKKRHRITEMYTYATIACITILSFIRCISPVIEFDAPASDQGIMISRTVPFAIAFALTVIGGASIIQNAYGQVIVFIQ